MKSLLLFHPLLSTIATTAAFQPLKLSAVKSSSASKLYSEEIKKYRCGLNIINQKNDLSADQVC
jgi:hypothetical protein